jgi:hypothetical protein
MLNVVMLSVSFLFDAMLNVIMLSVTFLFVAMLNVIMLSVTFLFVAMLNVIMLSVVASFQLGMKINRSGKAYLTWTQYYKTSFVHNLQMFVISSTTGLYPNIRLGWKTLSGANTLAYYKHT